MKPKSSLATIWLMIVRLFELHGLDTHRLLAEVGIRETQLRDPGERLPSRLVDVLFKQAEHAIADPAFALRAAECWHPSNLGTMGYAWLSSGSLRAALKRMERYNRIIGDRIGYQVIEEPGGLRFIYDHGRGDAAYAWPIADFSLSIIVDMCRTNFGAQLNPIEVTLRRPQPQDPKPYLVLFRCPVIFGTTADSFLLAYADADMRLPSANRQLATQFDTILTEHLARLAQDDLPTRCKAFLLGHLTSGVPSEAELARELGLSQRSLQRRLSEQGLSFKQLVDATRHELALRYLDDPRTLMTEITFLLGFSEQSAFARSFRRWQGQSPSAYRLARQSQSQLALDGTAQLSTPRLPSA
jgi:AraC-like DNA-binding protein